MFSVVGSDGQVYGPVPVETLRNWASQGRLNSKTNLIDPLDGRVMTADNLPELRSLFLVAPPIIPPVVPPQPASPGPTYNVGDARPGTPGGQPPYYGAPTTMPSAPVLQAAAFQQGAPGAPSVQVNNYIALNNQAAFVNASGLPGTRSKTTAILLCIFLGGLGIHRFYLGHKNSGLAMLLVTVLSVGYLSLVTGVWAIVDLINICTGSMQDADNRALV